MKTHKTTSQGAPIKLISKLLVVTGIIAVAMVPVAYALEVSQYYIVPGNTLGWDPFGIDGGTTDFVDGAPEGYGSASLELKTSASWYDRVGLMEWTNMSLADLTQASYWAKQIVTLDLTQTANLEIDVDLNGDFASYTKLVYKPSLQPGGAPVQNGVWQYWDATNGQYLSMFDYGTGESALRAGEAYSMSQIKQWYPFAQITAISVVIGDNLRNSTVNIDGITIGSSTYDIEKVVPESGDVVSVPKTIQDCKKYGWETLSTTEAEDFRNQGQCVSYIVSSKAKTK